MFSCIQAGSVIHLSGSGSFGSVIVGNVVGLGADGVGVGVVCVIV
jgi:hypothetical protein